MAAVAVISSASLEYVRVPVEASEAGTAVNPTADTVTMAFLPTSAAPVSGDFKTASWETDATVTPTRYYARCLVGAGGAVALTPGTYTVWVKIVDSPETPVKRCGPLKVT